MIDISVSLVLLICLLPLFLIVSLLILIESPGPIFYTQERVGLNLKLFKIFKFRSMVTNADKIGGYSTVQNDSRITKIGKFIRKTSIDELPQILNVLLGDMSLIGPRPNVPLQQENYSQLDWKIRHAVPPGVTGLAQALYRSSCRLEQQIGADIKYVNEFNMRLDIYIVYKTIIIIFLKSKAN